MRRIPVGSDVVEVAEDHIVIHARHPFPDWRIREFCRQPIEFKGQKFFLRNRRSAAPPHAIQYELEPWPEDLREESPCSFTYDEALVAARDAEFKTERRHSVLWCFLVPLYPLLGLFWTGFKEKTLWPIGFVPTSITSASIFLVLGLTLTDAIAFGVFGGGVVLVAPGVWRIDFWAWVAELILIGLLLLDCVTRFSQLLKGDEAVPYGFFEWILPSRRRPR